jgi:hypothetical protein
MPARRRGAPAALRLGPDQPGHPHRRDAEGHGIVAPQEPRGQVGVDLAAQRRGPEQDPVERRAVARGTLSLPVALSKYSQTKCGMRRLARALRSEIAGYLACRSIVRRKALRPGLVQPGRADPFIFPKIRKSNDGGGQTRIAGTICEQTFNPGRFALSSPMSSFDDSEAFEAASAVSLSAQAMAARPRPYLDGLNPAQLEAVQRLDGPVLMLAGAGTGKTRALTARIAHLLATGTARPNEILAVTFTNKAAREMKNRVGALLGQPAEGMPWLGTFHAICVKLLRRHAELVGLKSNFTILDTDDQVRLLKQLIVAAEIDEKRWPARQLASIIDGWKNRALTPDKIPSADAGAFNRQGPALYAEYQARLKTLNAVDFGDLLLHVIEIFQKNEDLLAQYQRWFRYILVDEYQDTNVAQYLWLRLLAQGT